MSRRCSDAAADQLRRRQIVNKSEPVYFFVAKNTPFRQTGQAIPFEIERLNVGVAFKLASDIFTAPQPGTYFFSFSGLQDDRASDGVVKLLLNGELFGTAFEYNYKFMTITQRAAVELKTGDQIKVVLDSGALHANSYLFTHFTGWLIEQKLFP